MLLYHISTSYDSFISQIHTLLCLMAKGEHCWKASDKKGDPAEAQSHAYLNVATLLNKAVNDGNYDMDIDKREVARMIDHVLESKKGAVGYISRQPARRLTRGMKQVWDRKPPINFTGSKYEWEHGRKAMVLGPGVGTTTTTTTEAGNGNTMESVEVSEGECLDIHVIFRFL